MVRLPSLVSVKLTVLLSPEFRVMVPPLVVVAPVTLVRVHPPGTVSVTV